MLTNGGDPHPVWQQRMFWAITEGVVAGILLLSGAMSASGDPLIGLQTAAVTTGLPFSIVLVFMCWGMLVQLRRDQILRPVVEKPSPLGEPRKTRRKRPR